MMRIGDRAPDTTEQEKALQLAQARLAHAEDKVENCRRWLRLLPEAIIDYEGPARQLSGILEADMPKADSLLENKIRALEEYVQLVGTGSTESVSSAKVTSAPEEEKPAAPETNNKEHER